MTAYPGRDGYEGAPSGVIWQTDGVGATRGIDTDGANPGDVPAWTPDFFESGKPGFAMRPGVPPLPADYAAVTYVLSHVGAVLTWLPLDASTPVLASGFGNNFGNDFGGPSA